ncbi:D-lactate dehydrogenase [Limoniibacter endophyticus]|uniref:Quinone-dependent D-lactate dehydrogenase n=1 Tax=Limoniibacter endophyticus TaxID=1565040 RepID=A0A8J3DR46_9HYPH|nr:D-lactate dehydrogenase [Limoniibacter endophyticus]GHC79065.1 D-lactate dehydrogenase [Limoniibacter endophyticus]
MTQTLLDDLRAIVGTRHLLTTPSQMRRFTHGYRWGEGNALAVAQPGTLVEMWKVIEASIAADAAVIAQAANTGLTGGSTPFGNDYDRPVVLVNTMRIKSLHMLGGGRQVLAFPGTTLDELETALQPLGREPHSVIGSSCLGASVIGGICNNSGGSLIRRGPAYTELALYARVTDNGRLELVNNLGISLGNDPADILRRIETKAYSENDIDWSDDKAASDPDYVRYVREIDAATPARYNADQRCLHEASGSAGKVIVFAVRLDTFEAEKETEVFYIGTNDPNDLTEIRRGMLADGASLPIAAEYIHREAFDISARYGKDTYYLVQRLGTRRLPKLFSLKSRIEAFFDRMPFTSASQVDRIMQKIADLLPSPLPERLKQFRDRFEHHLMIKVSAADAPALQTLLSQLYPKVSGDWFECTKAEGAAAFLHRFATAGAAVRYDSVHGKRTGGVIALDIALARNDREWMEKLPAEIDSRFIHKLYYGHFFCHVFHQDYLLKPGFDWMATKNAMLELLEKRNARYPAEHNVGHLYKAEETLTAHYRALDPCNCFNPGIGKTSKLKYWK